MKRGCRWNRSNHGHGGCLLPVIVALVVGVLIAACDDKPFPVQESADPVIVYELPDDGEPCAYTSPSPNLVEFSAGPRAVSDSAFVWGGWVEASIQSHANDEHGNVYQVDARWNTVPNPRATVLFLPGGGNHGWPRVARGWPFARALQDTLATMGIRSVNVQYTPHSELSPRNGWVNIAPTYADLLNRLRADGILEGFVIGSAGSGGAVLTAAAGLLHFSFDGMILTGGPFGIQPRALSDFVANGQFLSELEGFMYEDQGGFSPLRIPSAAGWFRRG